MKMTEQKEKIRSNDLISTLKGKKVTIIGHDNIDVDSVLSGILMSKLLDFLKIKNQFAILEEVKRCETYEILEDLLGIDMKQWEVKEENEERELFLVDHYETRHKGHIIGCIDHHPTKKENAYKFNYTKNSCAAAYMIYEIMQEVGFPIEKEIAKIIIIAMMIDTVAFRSSKTVPEEVEQAKKLAEEYQLDYSALEKSCLLLTPIEKLSTAEIISNGQKWYNYNGVKVGSSYLQLYGIPDEKKMNYWLNCLQERVKETKSDILIFVIFDTQNNITYIYEIIENGIYESIREGILSRGKNIMPEIEARYL